MAALRVKFARDRRRQIADIRLVRVKNIPVLFRILDKMLENDPENRYQTGIELAVALPSCLNKIKKK